MPGRCFASRPRLSEERVDVLVLPLTQAGRHRRSGTPPSVVGMVQPPRLRLGHRLHVELAVTQVDPHALAGLDLASEQPFRELVLQQPLDGSPQRARPVLWVEAGVRQVLDRLVRHLSRWARIRRATRPSSSRVICMS